MEKALVTGGAGFIGSNVVEKLVDQGVEVTVLDSLYLGSEDNLSGVRDRVRFIKGSVLDEEKLEDAVEGTDTVFHLAARSSSPMHKENPAEGARVNVEGFVRTAEAAKEEGAEKVVYASTSSMYGTVKPPHSEDKDVKPKNLYTASKLAREKYANCYSYTNQLETTGLRFFSVYGPHERAKGKYANVVTQFLWKMMEGEQPVIWGDGSQERDFVYVEDVARAVVSAAARDSSLDGEIFNVGTGDPRTFNEVVETLNEELGTDISPEHVENPRGENYVTEHRADISRAAKALDWEPEYSFEAGVERLVEFYS
ncbi:MAG: NAD-dependent epimerase/dehydratase family protein [Candidatus Nanohaloarchaea archaeon]